jgi:hypothetical protein
MSSMSAAWRRWLAGAALGIAGFAGCLSPTLPLPPPEEPDGISQGEDGYWGLSGACAEGAEVIAVNESTGRGAVYIDRAGNGRYSVEVEGEECDVVVISQILSDDPSGEIRVVLREVVDSLDVDPEACR